MNDNSFVFLWRKITKSSFYKKPKTCHLAIHLILKASFLEHKTIIAGKETNILRGQIPCGRNRLSEDTGLSPQEIRTCLKHLEGCGFLTIKSTKACSIITICKYDEYQSQQLKHQPKS